MCLFPFVAFHVHNIETTEPNFMIIFYIINNIFPSNILILHLVMSGPIGFIVNQDDETIPINYIKSFFTTISSKLTQKKQ